MIILIPTRTVDAGLVERIDGLLARGLRDIVVVVDGGAPAAVAGATVLAADRGHALRVGLAHACERGEDVVVVMGRRERTIPAAALPGLLALPGKGREFAFHVLTTAVAARGPRVLAYVLPRFVLSSLGCAVVDVLVFSLLAYGSLGIGVAVGVARAASSLLNFWLNRGFVFRSDRPVAVAVGLYYVLVGVVALLSYLLTRTFAEQASLPLVAAKIAADSLLFVVSFLAQRYLVFARRRPAAFITPAGAGIAIICFFLPWVRVSCLRDLEFTGLEIAQLKDIYWLVLAGEVAVLVLWTLGALKILRNAAVGVATAATIALAVIFAPVLRGERTRGLDLELLAGAYGTVLGLTAALLGAISWRRVSTRVGRRRPRTDPPASPPRSGSA